MRVTESLIRQNKINNQKKNQYKEDEGTTLLYKEEKREYWALNQNQPVFESGFSKGINTTESVFEQKAIFKTGER